MIWENTKLLLRFYYRPLSAMSGVIDGGHWLYAAVAVAALSILLQFTVTSPVYNAYEAVYLPVEKMQGQIVNPGVAAASPAKADAEGYDSGTSDYEDTVEPTVAVKRLPLPFLGNYGWWFLSFEPSFFSAVIGIALYVPCLILLAVMSSSIGGFGVVCRRDYGPLLTCALMAWVASHLPFALLGLALSPVGLGARTALVLWSLGAVGFCLLMALAMRTLFGINYSKGLVLVCVGALSFSVQSKLFAVVSPFMFSPCLLFYAYYMFRNNVGDIGFSLRQRQNFRRSMEAATINPRDAGAHYQLGLILLSRRQYAEAISRFGQAVAIDKDETDAHYQLGRIAREQGRLPEAINRFGVVLGLDDKHALSEVWREVGATYLAASMFTEARDALDTFIERRLYDPEGLYYYGKTLEQLGETERARVMFERCVEAAETMPHYRHGDQRKWHKLARERLTTGPQTAG